MPLFIWDSEFIVGLSSIDAEHQALVAQINALYDFLRESPNDPGIRNRAETLLDHMEAHFQTEESLFEQSGYPLDAAHRAEHDRFRGEIAVLRQNMLGHGDHDAAMEILNYLVAWLAGHMAEQDRAYAPHFTAHGVT